MVYRLWKIRGPDKELFDPYEIYGNEPTLFTLKVYHGGSFIENQGLKYTMGKIGYVDMVDADEFSVHEFDLMIQKLGYAKEEVIYYYYRIPFEDLNIGLRPLGNDKDVLDLFKYIEKYKVICVYTEHGGTTIKTFFMPNESYSSVVIEEIADEVPTVLSFDMQDGSGMIDNVGGERQLVDNVSGERQLVDNVGGEGQLVDNVYGERQLVDNVDGERQEADNIDGEMQDIGAVQDEIDDPFDGLDDILGTNASEINNENVMATEGEEAPNGNDDVEDDVNEVGNQAVVDDGNDDVEDDVNEVGNQAVEDAVNEVGNQAVVDDVNEVENQADKDDGNGVVNQAHYNYQEIIRSDEIFIAQFIDGYSRDQDDGENVDSDEDHEGDNDSDYIVDEENVIEDVEDDMDVYRANVDGEDDAAESDHENEIEVLDFDDFDSSVEEESEDVLSKAIREINIANRKKKKSGPTITGEFYVGQSFVTKEQIRDMVVNLALESRRQLVYMKNDKLRMRVVCYGQNPESVCSQGQSSKSCDVGESSQLGGASKGKASKVGGPTALNNVKKRFPTPTCPWLLHISRKTEEDVWIVKTLKGEHKCLHSRNIRLYTVSCIAREIEDLLESNPTIPIGALRDMLQKKHQVHISLQKVFRAKTMALCKIHGDYTDQYSLLRGYSEEILRSNPGSTVKIDVERECNPSIPTRQFKRIYICFAALKAGFKACGRDILGLDGCFIKGPYPGQILSAVGVDSNNGIYPVAYAIVESESLASWTWFLQCLGDDLDLNAHSNFTFISDRQKGIIPALKNVFPAAEHRYCVRHIHDNMRSKWRGNLYKDLLWKTASQRTIPQFDNSMEEIRKKDESLHQWLRDIPPRHWSRAYFSERPQCEVLLNNLCEVFNRQLVGGRDKPILTCLEFIREYCMRRIAAVHRVIAKSEGPLTPAAAKMFSFSKTKAAEYNVIMAGAKKFQVIGPWLDQVVVDLDKRTCSCRKWQLTGMPCSHSIACIWEWGKIEKEAGIPEAWVSKVYWLETWKNVYGHTMEPMNGRTMWPTSQCPTTLIPPKHHTPIGRPSKKRKKSAGELSEGINSGGKLTRKGATTTCSKCKQKGHNARSCRGEGSSTAAGSSTVPNVGNEN